MSPRPASRTETCLGRCGLWSLRERVGYKGPTWLVVVLILWCPDRGRDRCCRPVGDRVSAAGAVAAGVELAGGLGWAAAWLCSSCWWCWPRLWGACWCGARTQAATVGG